MDYKDIIENLNDEKVLQLMISLGADNYINKDGYYIFPTICHNYNIDEASMKLYYYKNTKLFVCYTECESMSIFTFLKHYYEARGIEYDWYEDIFKVITNCSAVQRKTGFDVAKYKSLKSKYEPRKNRKKLESYPLGIMEVFMKFYPPEWLNDGISKEAMDKFGIRYSPSKNKIVIPHLDEEGDLVGIRGRALDKWEVENVGKYMPMQIENKWYSHPLSLNLYGLYENKENIKKTGVCFLVEGEKSVLRAESFSQPNCCVAVCGSKINKFHIDLLMRTCQPKEVIVCFDKEEDINGSYFNKLYNMCRKYKLYTNMSFVYDRENLLNLKDSPTDKGEAIFKKLVEKRRRV